MSQVSAATESIQGATAEDWQVLHTHKAMYEYTEGRHVAPYQPSNFGRQYYGL